MNYWKPAEDAKLIALYPDHSAGQIAAALGRSRISVKNRVNAQVTGRSVSDGPVD